MENQIIQSIVDSAVKDITRRVAHIELEKTNHMFEHVENVHSLSVNVGGAYQIFIVYHAEERLMRTIASQMKHGPPEDGEEIALYTKEYFNILCGHVVSAINQLTHSSARFGIPTYSKGAYTQAGECDPFFEVSYQSCEGHACIQGVLREKSDLLEPWTSFVEVPAGLTNGKEETNK